MMAMIKNSLLLSHVNAYHILEQGVEEEID